MRPDFPGLHDLLSAYQDKLGSKCLLINLVGCPPTIKDQGCLLSSSLCYFVWLHCSRCFVTLPTGTTVGRGEKRSGHRADFSKLSELNVALTKAII